MSKKVYTIKGPVDHKGLGFTYPHEHLVCYPPEIAGDLDLELPSEDRALEELELFEKCGGGTLVEGTALDYGRDIKAMERIAQKTDVNIVFTTGFNKGRFYQPWVIEIDTDELADLFVRELMEGAEGTKLKPGYLKCGSWYNVILPHEEKVTRAVARAHKKTEAPIWVHTEAGTMGLEQLDILEEEGADLNKVCVGHLDRNPDYFYHKKIASRGAYVGYDGPGKIKYYPDSVRIDLIKRLLDAGYGERLLISGDMGRKSYLKAYGGGPGFDFLLTKFIPRLKEEGLSSEDIDQIWVKNPAEWLAY